MGNIIGLIIYYSLIYNVPWQVSLAVAKVESNLNHSVVGADGEVGIFQIKPQYYKKIKLTKLEDNIKYGIKHLAEAKKYCKHQVDYTFVLCYNLGVEGAKRVRYPKLFPYYKKVRQFIQ